MWVSTKAVLTTFVCIFALGLAGQASAIGISPTVADVDVLPGEIIDHTVKVLNDQDDVITYDIELLGVELGESSAEMSFFDLSDREKTWMVLSDSSFSLAPGETRDVSVKVTPYAGQDSTTRVLGVKITEASGESGGVRVGNGFISLIFLTIGDELFEDYELLDFSIVRNVAGELPVSFLLTIRNSGDRILQPQGEVSMRNLFGNVITSIELNPEARRISSGQAKTFISSWAKDHARLPPLGIYHVELEMSSWNGGEAFTQTRTIAVIPARVIASAILAFVIIVLAVRYTSATRR